MKRITAGLILSMGVIAACESPEREPEPRAEAAAEARVVESMVVSGDWLTDHLDDPDVLLVQVGGTEAEYQEDLMPGARFLPLSAVSTERDGLMGQLPAVEELEATFAELGVTGTTRVVFYGAPLAAARAFVAMDVLGAADRAALLDGGLPVWREEEGPVTAGDAGPEIPPGTDPGAEPGQDNDRDAGFAPEPERVVDAEWVSDQADRADVVLLDARPTEQYTGEEAGDDVPRAGHIPGARNLFWEHTIESVERPTLRDADALRRLFEEAGVTPGDTVVTYCRSGLQSSFLYFVSRYLGYETRLYDGSFMDWSSRSDLPVETGPGAVVESGS